MVLHAGHAASPFRGAADLPAKKADTAYQESAAGESGWICDFAPTSIPMRGLRQSRRSDAAIRREADAV